jgi:RNA-directed DNA polymerase
MRRGREETAGVVAGLRLRPAQADARIVHLSEGLRFPGFRLQWRRKRGTAKWYARTFVNGRLARSPKAKIRP